MVSIDHAALTIDRQHPIGIAIEGKAHGSSAVGHRLAQRVEMGGTTTHIDATTIGVSMQNGDCLLYTSDAADE